MKSYETCVYGNILVLINECIVFTRVFHLAKDVKCSANLGV